jgi:hypothetical protein
VPPLLAEALPFLVPALLPALLVLIAPLAGRRARIAFGALLLLGGAGFLVDVALFDHSAVVTLEVPNVFADAETGQLREWRVATESAPVWAWHVAVAGWLLLHGTWLLARRGRPPAAPHPVVHGAGLFLIYLTVRLVLEKCAAHRPIVWAVGSAPALVAMLPFLGWYAGARGWSLRRFAGALVLMALAQRVPLVAFGWLATTRGLGTHLDTHAVTQMRGLWGPRHFDGDPVQAWIWTTLVPHMTLWIATTLVAGLVLGALPWWAARRRVNRACRTP